MRSLFLFVIGLVFGATGGFLAGGGIDSAGLGHDHAGHGDAAHDHSDMAQWAADTPVPSLSLSVFADTMSGVNLHITAPDFAMTPEVVGQADQVGGGHAHIYLNGQKVGRVYSDWVHLGTAKSGDVVRVTLNGNSHAGWMGPDGPLAAEVTVP